MKKIIVLNHKSYLNYEEIKTYPIELNQIIRTDQTVIVCPSAIYMPYFKGKYSFKLGSQNIENENITGELTGEALKSMEIKYALTNSNDRKNKYSIESKDINSKIKAAIANGITPIVVVGETYYENELNKTLKIIEKQIKDYFDQIEVNRDIILVYSPNWSYKGKEVPSLEHITEAIDLIKNIVKRKYDTNIRVLYGGDISIENISKLDKISNIDGYLITDISRDLNKLKNFFNEIE